MTPETPAPNTASLDPAGLDAAAAQQRLRKLHSKATRLKLDLHDLAEDLPIGWEGLLDVARRTYDAYAEIALLEGLAEKETSR
ncbi:CCE_0567 family metalloprotein [Frankia gtarii]|uniref:CCE_0567 family metalloprotein n=1 Tax=Frankia gtarii TaxID=2950102 RepID=UPI0021BFBE30|nr:CCE_0567 family metalloprotein [Frankia gtarii]